jgi:type IV pilus assembly protein PilW
MNPIPPLCKARGAGGESGYSLIEVTVAMAIAAFLLAGLFTIFQGTRHASTEQTGFSELQDEQRLAVTMITDIVQSAGFFTNATTSSAQAGLPNDGGNFATDGQALYGTTAATTGPDTMTVRFQTGTGDTVLNCNGTSNTSGSPVLYSNTFSIAVNAAGVSQLLCLLSTNGVAAAQALPLVNNVTNLQFWYAVNTTNSITTTSITSTGGAAAGSFTNAGCPADTYIATTDMGATDWTNVCAVRVLLTFVNPLYQPPGQPNPTKGQPATIQFARVISVLGKAAPNMTSVKSSNPNGTP